MRPPRLGTLFALAACLILVIPASALSIPSIGEKDNGFSITDETYLRTYEKCWKAFDSQCGRNIVDDGLAGGKPPAEARIAASTATMERWLNPPEPAPVAVDSPASIAPTPVASTVAPAPVASGGCPSYMAGEADSPSDVNPTSGAAGCFQIIPSTQAAYGCAAPDAACAATICADPALANPDDQWVSADPCAYLQP